MSLVDTDYDHKSWSGGLFLKTAPIMSCNLLSLRAGLYEVVGEKNALQSRIVYAALTTKSKFSAPRIDSDPETGAG